MGRIEPAYRCGGDITLEPLSYARGSATCSDRPAAIHCHFTFTEWGFTMFLIADLLERAKAGAGIDSDYRLAKIIGITHGAMSHYRMGRTLPNEKVIEQLCALSGDDPDLIAAQIQAARAPNEAAKNLWLRIAARLGGGVSTAVLSVLFTIGLIALPADPAQAASAQSLKSAANNSLYIV